jgi:hypothetical protein
VKHIFTRNLPSEPRKIKTKNNKKFWEELIAYFSFIIFVVSDTRSRKKTLVCMRNKVNKIIQFGSLEYLCYRWEWFMKFAIETDSVGTIYVPSFMKIISGIQVRSRLLPRQFERLRCLQYKWEYFILYAVGMNSHGMTDNIKLHNDRLRN